MNIENIARQLVELVRETGHYLLQERQNFDRGVVEFKGINDLVSYVDKQAEIQLVAGLKNILPDSAFITEEGTEGSLDWNNLNPNTPYWIIDPLDGTTNFVHGLPIFAISIGLLFHGKLIVGCVHDPNRNECFYAWEGGGAWCNEMQIHVSPAPELKGCLLATGFPYFNFSGIQKYLNTIHDFMQKCHGLRRMGSAAIDLAYVASGRFEGFFEYNLNPWDVAGGMVLVQEAGGKVTDFSGQPHALFGREIVAAGPAHSEILDVIAENWG